MNESIHLRWEKATAWGVRDYQVDLHLDLWGEWLLTQAWGRRGARLGRVRVVPCGTHAEGLVQIAAIGKRRRQSTRQCVLIVRSPVWCRDEPGFPLELDAGFGFIQRGGAQ